MFHQSDEEEYRKNGEFWCSGAMNETRNIKKLAKERYKTCKANTKNQKNELLAAMLKVEKLETFLERIEGRTAKVADVP